MTTAGRSSTANGAMASSQHHVSDYVYQGLSAFFLRTSGFALTREKTYLIDTRLTRVAAALKFASVESLTRALVVGASPEIERAVIEAMTTNETLFFRDSRPFEVLRKNILPSLVQTEKKIRVLCAAASTGQEPYSVAITYLEAIGNKNIANIEIVAIDIDRSVLAKAEKATYTPFEVQRGVPSGFLLKYFDQLSSNDWKVKNEVAKLVTFRYGNLLEDMSRLGSFDIIFCRNVLIYFDMPTKISVLSRLTKQLRPDGHLFLGSAETIVGSTERFAAEPSARGLYKYLG